MLELTYGESLIKKEKALLELIPEVASVFLPTVALDQVPGSRSKVKLAVFRKGAKLCFGFHDDRGVPREMEQCPMHRSELNALLPVIAAQLEHFKIEPYDLNKKNGELKFLILSQSQSHEEILLRFTLRSKEALDRLKKMGQVLQQHCPKIKVITANLQPLHQAIMEGDVEIVLTDEERIRHRFEEVHLSLGPRSFFQVTPQIACRLYSAVGALVKQHGIQSFLDLYCGVGAFSYFAAKSAHKVLGVELSPEAIKCAKSSLEFNQCQGEVAFASVDVEKFLRTQSAAFEAILVNPPRRGLNPAIIESIQKNNPQYIFYSSCNAHTLARDHELLKQSHELISSQIFDMFPFTEHFETLMLYRCR